MPLNAVRAIVLRSSVIKEQDKLVSLLTDEQGILRAIAPGAAKNRNRFGSLLESFTMGEFFYYWNEEKETVTLTKGEIKKSYFDLISRIDNMFYFSLMAEIIIKFVPHHHQEPRLYRLLVSLLENRERGIPNPHLMAYFLVWILRLEGLLFQPTVCSNCHEKGLERAWLRQDFRGILCSRCHRGETEMLDSDELRYIQWTRCHGPEEMAVPEGQRHPQHLIRILVRKIEYHGDLSLTCTQYLPEFR